MVDRYAWQWQIMHETINCFISIKDDSGARPFGVVQCSKVR